MSTSSNLPVSNSRHFLLIYVIYLSAGGYKLWKRLSFFVAFPAVGLCLLNAYLKHVEEHESGHPRQEFVKYEYLRVRNKRFPWGGPDGGKKSLFHNPDVNALPDGYETEAGHH